MAHRKQKLTRTIKIKLYPSKTQASKLFDLIKQCASAWNHVNKQRMNQYKQNIPVDFKKTGASTYNKYKKIIGAATAQQITRKNAEAWKSFFTLSRKKTQRQLPSWFKPQPPGPVDEYPIILRQDMYKLENHKLYIHGLGKYGKMYIPYKGKLYLKGHQGEAKIIYDETKNTWYAYITIHASEKLTKNGWEQIPRQPKNDLAAGIDIGINNLLAVYVEDGRSFLVNGRPLKSIAYYWRRQISEYQSKLNRAGASKSKKLRRIHAKMRNQLKDYINKQVRMAMEKLYGMGVSKVYVGYPKNIARNGKKGKKQNFLVSTAWHYNYVIRRLQEVGEELGISVMPVDEAYSSITDPFTGNRCKECRFVRSFFMCPGTGLVLNADLVGAYNILAGASEKTITPSRPGFFGFYCRGGGNGRWPGQVRFSWRPPGGSGELPLPWLKTSPFRAGRRS